MPMVATLAATAHTPFPWVAHPWLQLPCSAPYLGVCVPIRPSRPCHPQSAHIDLVISSSQITQTLTNPVPESGSRGNYVRPAKAWPRAKNLSLIRPGTSGQRSVIYSGWTGFNWLRLSAGALIHVLEDYTDSKRGECRREDPLHADVMRGASGARSRAEKSPQSAQTPTS